MKMERVLDKLPKLLTDPEFAECYAASAEEFILARELIKARATAGLSQQELSPKMSTTQSVVARLESGRHLPTMSTLKKLAAATGTRLSIHFDQVD
jgi:DNA-binding transcriptional regulator YiaG